MRSKTLLRAAANSEGASRASLEVQCFLSPETTFSKERGFLTIEKPTYSPKDQAGQMSPSQQLPPSPGFQEIRSRAIEE